MFQFVTRFGRVLVLVGATVTAPPLGAQVPATSPSSTPDEGVPRWRIDVAHSELTFRIRHLVSRVSGTFLEWGGTVVAHPSRLDQGSVEVTIQAASINTRNERRDDDLRSERFFDAANHSEIRFRSTGVEEHEGVLRVSGELTIRGITRPVVLEGEYTGITGSPGQRRMGFNATTKVDRNDFRVSWNRAVEGGGLLLGDEVEIQIFIEAVETGA